MKRNFDEWLKGFRYSIADYGYYVDFAKVYRNVDGIKVELNIMNSLIGSRNIENDFINLASRYPEILKCIPTLLAVRANEIFCRDENGARLYDFCIDAFPTSGGSKCDEYVYFMRKTGLFELLEKHIVNNLVDYVTGVETGLDSNGRKNRGGHLMEDLVEDYIRKSGKEYYKEMYLDEIERKWGVDLSALSNNGKTRKRFDFVIKTPGCVYAVETNFYGGYGGGSKLNETARSYKMLARESDGVEGFSFVWFTDGTAWNSAKGNLREAFEAMEHIYNINDLDNGIIEKALV